MALPGPFLAGQRLTAGQLNDATQKTLKTVEVGTSGIIGTTSGTTELNIAKLGFGPVPMVNGGLYTFGVHLILQMVTSGAQEYLCTIRRDTALTGTVVAQWTIYNQVGTGGFSFTNWQDVPWSADENVTFFVSFQRLTGANTMNIYGQITTVARSGSKVARSGYASEYSLVP